MGYTIAYPTGAFGGGNVVKEVWYSSQILTQRASPTTDEHELDFRNNQLDEAEWWPILPLDYVAGTDWQAVLRWNQGAAGEAVFEVVGVTRYPANGATFTAYTPSPLTTAKHVYSSGVVGQETYATMDGSSLLPGDGLRIRFVRQGTTDSYGTSVGVIFVGLRYTANPSQGALL